VLLVTKMMTRTADPQDMRTQRVESPSRTAQESTWSRMPPFEACAILEGRLSHGIMDSSVYEPVVVLRKTFDWPVPKIARGGEPI
jgi:hypothetical protein